MNLNIRRSLFKILLLELLKPTELKLFGTNHHKDKINWKYGLVLNLEIYVMFEQGWHYSLQIVTHISLFQAVSLMKTSRQLELVVRKSAGSELFPGESSGYNSSASSVTGDQSPSWSDSKRLSIVKEENLDLEDRLSHLDRLNKRSKEKKIS